MSKTNTEIAEAYGISRNHLVKVVHNLSIQGFIETSRGKSGGLWLGRRPEHINIGAVVRSTEPNFNVVECFDEEKNTCPIIGICKLQTILSKASRAFLRELDNYTLADLMTGKRKLLDILAPA